MTKIYTAQEVRLIIQEAKHEEREAIATEFMKRHEAVKHLNNYWHHAANYVRERGRNETD